ncbi:uncharacterized protein LOC144107809 [Amblyomma americanum]
MRMIDATGVNASSDAAAKRAAHAAAERRRRQDPAVRAAEAAAKRRRREDPAVRAAQAEAQRRRQENKRRAATFPASSGSSMHHSSGPPGSNAGDGGDEDAAYSCTKFTSAAAVHRADAECQVRVLPTVFSRFTQCSARLDVKSVQCDLDADWFMRITSSAGMQRKKKGSASCMVEEQEEERRKNLPMPVAPPAPRCILCGLERTHNTMLHPLPVYKSSCQKWIDFVRQCPGRADLLGWMPPAHEQSFVCSLHFAPGSFTRLFPEKRLRPGAVPTLYPKAALVPTVGVLTGPADCVGTSF